MSSTTAAAAQTTLTYSPLPTTFFATVAGVIAVLIVAVVAQREIYEETNRQVIRFVAMLFLAFGEMMALFMTIFSFAYTSSWNLKTYEAVSKQPPFARDCTFVVMALCSVGLYGLLSPHIARDVPLLLKKLDAVQESLASRLSEAWANSRLYCLAPPEARCDIKELTPLERRALRYDESQKFFRSTVIYRPLVFIGAAVCFFVWLLATHQPLTVHITPVQQHQTTTRVHGNRTR